MIEIEIDGKTYSVEPGKMIIEVADEHGVYIPRFCYHKKLSIAANCRMCLVEVEKSRKPLPACATPVAPNMRVFTKSELARDAQKSVMEFLLINHPLDCPICDQGGECELQDVSLGYGKDISRFTEDKRVVEDENIGSLVATDMTRCIHCTRCVRFGDEVAGILDLGVLGRGENTQIGVFVEHALKSEVSANIIDLCPVGALTNKPYRFKARPWELNQLPSISPHDCLGTNIYFHARRGEIMRAVPKENEAINETWLADRDRFSHLGLYTPDRLTQPEIKRNGVWIPCDWQEALDAVVNILEPYRASADQENADFGALISPNASLEEQYLLQKLCRELGSNHIDHRLRVSDFRDDFHQPLAPISSFSYAELSQQKVFLLLGSNIHQEQPLAGLRIRTAVTKKDAKVYAFNPVPMDYHFPLTQENTLPYEALIKTLVEGAKILAPNHPEFSRHREWQEVRPSDQNQAWISDLKEHKGVIILGALITHHPEASLFRSLARLISQETGCHYLEMTDGGNSAGAWLAGAVPHRSAGGISVRTPGLNAYEMWNKPLKNYILVGGIEPEQDCINPALALQALQQAENVIAITPYVTDVMRRYATILLPAAPFTETSGTLVNLEGQAQSFTAVSTPLEDTVRPTWKILRVLGTLFNLPGFNFNDSQEVRVELERLIELAEIKPLKLKPYVPERVALPLSQNLKRIGEWPIYRVDNIVRRSEALQQAPTQMPLAAILHPNTAMKLNLQKENKVKVEQTDHGEPVILPLVLDERMPENYVRIPAGYRETMGLGNGFGEVVLTRVSIQNNC